MKPAKFHDVIQNEDEWYQLRSGILTSSKMGCVMANTKGDMSKPFGDVAKKYAVNVAIEQITGKPISSGYSNDHMQRGHEQEPIARALYESETFCTVTNGGYFETELIGCSPDGMADKGVIEIKSVIAHVHYANIKRAGVDPAYKWQCITNLMITGAEWMDFISYCADFPVGNQLFTHRIFRDDHQDDFNDILERAKRFNDYVNEVKNTIQGV